MAALAAGGRIIVKGADRPLVVRALRSAELDGGWVVPVMADLAALKEAGVEPGQDGAPGQIEVEIVTDQGPVCLDAEFVHSGDLLLVRAPGLRAAALAEQRRNDVRAAVALPVRGTILAAAGRSAAPGTNARKGAGTGAGAGPGGGVVPGLRPAPMISGATQNVSGSGLCLLLDALPGTVAKGSRLYLELSLPGGDLVPAIVTLVTREPAGAGVLVRVSFSDISPRDTERLIRLVFTRQRAELAERRTGIRPVSQTD